MLSGIFLSAGELPPGNILALDMTLIIHGLMLGVIILVMIMVMANILYNPVKRFMAERAERVRADVEAARLSREQASAIKAEYHAARGDIEREKEEILSEAHRAAVKKGDRILFDAQEEAKDLITRAKDEIKRECESADGDMKAQVAEIAALMAGRFVDVADDGETRAIFAEFIEEAWADWGEKA